MDEVIVGVNRAPVRTVFFADSEDDPHEVFPPVKRVGWLKSSVTGGCFRGVGGRACRLSPRAGKHRDRVFVPPGLRGYIVFRKWGSGVCWHVGRGGGGPDGESGAIPRP